MVLKGLRRLWHALIFTGDRYIIKVKNSIPGMFVMLVILSLNY